MSYQADPMQVRFPGDPRAPTRVEYARRTHEPSAPRGGAQLSVQHIFAHPLRCRPVPLVMGSCSLLTLHMARC